MEQTPSRRVLGAVAAVLAVVGLVVLVSVLEGNLLWLTPPATSPCATSYPRGQTPHGTAFALGTPQEQVWGENHWYNASIQSASGGLVFSNLAFEVQTSTGSMIAATGSWTLVVVDLAGHTVAAYSWAGTNWTEGGSLTVSTSGTISFDSGSTSLSHVGDALLVVMSGTCQAGSVSTPIP